MLSARDGLSRLRLQAGGETGPEAEERWDVEAQKERSEAASKISALVTAEGYLLSAGLKKVVSEAEPFVVEDTCSISDLPSIARTTGVEVVFVAVLNEEPQRVKTVLQQLPEEVVTVCLLPPIGYRVNSSVLEEEAKVRCVPITSAPEEIAPTILQHCHGRGAPRAVSENRRRGDDCLTNREREVLANLSWGKSNRAMAGDLFVTEETIKAHLSSIYSKLGVRKRTEAITAYLQNAA